MAYEQPIAQQETTGISASEDRKAYGSLGQPSVATGGSLVVTQRAAGANMSVDVAAGTAIVPQGQGTETVKRVYPAVTNTATVNLAINAAPAVGGQSRNDLIVCQIRDNAVDAGGVNDWYLRVITGTAATTGAQVDPAVPDHAYALARVTLAFGDASVTNAKITDLRTSNTSRALSGQTASGTAGANVLRHNTTSQRLDLKLSTDANNGAISGTDSGLWVPPDTRATLTPAALATINNAISPASTCYFLYPARDYGLVIFPMTTIGAANSNYASAAPLTVTRTTTLASIFLGAVYGGGATGTYTAYAALYTSVNGRPGTKIADLGSASWTGTSYTKELVISSPPTLTAGVQYFLSFHVSSNLSGGNVNLSGCAPYGAGAQYNTQAEITAGVDPQIPFGGGAYYGAGCYMVNGGSWSGAIGGTAPTTWLSGTASANPYGVGIVQAFPTCRLKLT